MFCVLFRLLALRYVTYKGKLKKYELGSQLSYPCPYQTQNLFADTIK